MAQLQDITIIWITIYVLTYIFLIRPKKSTNLMYIMASMIFIINGVASVLIMDSPITYLAFGVSTIVSWNWLMTAWESIVK